MTQHTNPVPVTADDADLLNALDIPKSADNLAIVAAHRHRLAQSTPADAPSGEDVCANCKGVIGDLAPGREPDELCDTCYDDATATLRTAADPEPAGAQEVVGAAERLSRFCKEWRGRMALRQSCEEIYALHMGDPREAVCDVRDIEALLAALPQPPADEVK